MKNGYVRESNCSLGIVRPLDSFISTTVSSFTRESRVFYAGSFWVHNKVVCVFLQHVSADNFFWETTLDQLVMHVTLKR